MARSSRSRCPRYPVRSSTDSSRLRLPIGPVRQSRSDEGVLPRDGWPGCGCGDRSRAGRVSVGMVGATAVAAVSLICDPSVDPLRPVGRRECRDLLADETTMLWGPRRRTHAPGVRLAADGPARVASWSGPLPGHEWITTACRDLLLGAPASDSASGRRQDRGCEEPTPSVHRGSSPRRSTDATKSRQQESDQ